MHRFARCKSYIHRTTQHQLLTSLLSLYVSQPFSFPSTVGRRYIEEESRVQFFQLRMIHDKWSLKQTDLGGLATDMQQGLMDFYTIKFEMCSDLPKSTAHVEPCVIPVFGAVRALSA